MLRTGGRGAAALTASLSVLLLSLGLIAMHHLDGGRHDAAHAPVSAIAGAPVHGAPALPVTHTAHRSTHTGGTDDALALAQAPPPVDAGTAVACLAVLLGAGVVLVLYRSGFRRTRGPRTPSSLRTAGRPPGRGPPRLLLAELCVLRI